MGMRADGRSFWEEGRLEGGSGRDWSEEAPFWARAAWTFASATTMGEAERDGSIIGMALLALDLRLSNVRGHSCS